MSTSVPVLIIANERLVKELAKIVIESHTYALVRTTKDILSYNQIVEIAKFKIEDLSYSLIRMVSK